MKIYSVFDSVTGKHGLPFFQENDFAAVRALVMSWYRDDPSTVDLNAESKDFQIYCYGDWTDGQFTMLHESYILKDHMIQDFAHSIEDYSSKAFDKYRKALIAEAHKIEVKD